MAGRPDFTRPVERPADRAARVGDLNIKNDGGSISSGSTVALEFANDSGSPLVLERADLALDDNYVENLRILIYVGSAITTGTLVGSVNVPQMPVHFDPGVRVPDGESVFISVKNNSASSESVTGISYLRPEEV